MFVVTALFISSFNIEPQVLRGSAVDEKKEPMMVAVITLLQHGRIVASTFTDYDGNYVLNNF